MVEFLVKREFKRFLDAGLGIPGSLIADPDLVAFFATIAYGGGIFHDSPRWDVGVDIDFNLGAALEFF